jgi:phosphoenolpyruvate-protein phosphotransferase
MDESARQILSAHLALIADPMLAATVESHIAGGGIDARAALERAMTDIASEFQALADPVLRQRAADLRDVCECIGRHLAGETPLDDQAAAPAVICAADLSPAQVIALAPSHPLAFVLEHGAELSHAAILMRALEVPALIGIRDATTLLNDGDIVVVDGNRGEVRMAAEPELTIAPSAAIAIDASDSGPAVTSDGVGIAVTATITTADDARRAMAAGADGIGLVRTEMFLLAGARLPSDQTQEEFYRQILSAAGSRRVTFRLLDLGGDKRPPAMQLPDEPNPALGLRGVRLLLARPDLFMTHLRALLRAGTGPLRLLVPMVVDASDISQVRELINEVAREVASKVSRIDVGAMVETPAAALNASAIASAADFVSIGTNDLAQYVLAADRNCAHMASFYQPLHPAVLRLVRDVTRTATGRGISVSVCGETAADPRAIPIFVGMGITELSVRPAAVAAVKAQVRRTSRAVAESLVDAVVSLSTAADVIKQLASAGVEASHDVRETCNPH